jgi:hypothetical protein
MKIRRRQDTFWILSNSRFSQVHTQAINFWLNSKGTAAMSIPRDSLLLHTETSTIYWTTFRSPSGNLRFLTNVSYRNPTVCQQVPTVYAIGWSSENRALVCLSKSWLIDFVSLLIVIFINLRCSRVLTRTSCSKRCSLCRRNSRKRWLCCPKTKGSKHSLPDKLNDLYQLNR